MNRSVQVDIESPKDVEPDATQVPQLLSVAEGYARWAPVYDDRPNPLLAREERYLNPLVADLRGKSVLDIACGTGRWLEKLALRGCESGVGIDLSRAMLQVAGAKGTISGRLAQATCEDLPLAGKVFDLVICSFALGHIHNLGPVVSELQRVTNVGADIFVSDLHPAAYRLGWRVGFRDREASVQIEIQSRSIDEIVAAFSSNRFVCLTHLPLWLGEPERHLFARAGKSTGFEDACQLPAVLVCHFRRVE